MTKRIAKQLDSFKYKGEPARITLGTLALVGICSFLIVIATFTQFSFVHYIIPWDFMNYIGSDLSKSEIAKHFQVSCRYIPQVPIIIFIAGLLGRRFGILSVIAYILVGLFLYPVFALGGGWKYIFEYGFGYILAYIPAVFFTGSIIKSGFSYRNMAQATLVGVLTIHLIGISYMAFLATIHHETTSMILGWITMQSGIKMIYDFVFGFFAMICAKYLKKFFWITMS